MSAFGTIIHCDFSSVRGGVCVAVFCEGFGLAENKRCVPEREERSVKPIWNIIHSSMTVQTIFPQSEPHSRVSGPAGRHGAV